MTENAPQTARHPIPSRDLPAIERLIRVMSALRDPDGGCPWDLEQTFETIAPYTIEEAYEVADAITEGDLGHLKEELGDLLLQVVYHAQMASETGSFDFEAVAHGIADKMVKRHPHVFAQDSVASAEAQTRRWEEQKADERKAKAAANGTRASALDGVSAAFPALMRAVKLQKRAARVGFDWPEATQVLDKIEEEIGEVRAELATGAATRDADRIEDEVGDLLFACVNLARQLGVDPESALRRCNRKFETRFRAIEDMLHADSGRTPDQASLDELEAYWQKAKRR